MSDDAAPANNAGAAVPPDALSRELLIINKRGLHARASAKFVQMVEKFEAEVWVTRGGETVGGTSIMGLMMLSAAGHPDLGVEPLHHLDEFGRGPRMQAALVDDQKFPGDCVGRNGRPGIVCGRRVVVFAHLPARTRLAMVTYLRPASWAMAMASGSERSSRTLASLTSMGR